MRSRDEDEEMVRDTQPVFGAHLFIRLTSYFLPLTSCLLLLTSYFFSPSSSFAQGHYQTLSSASPLEVTPDTINFGRVRIGQERDSSFTILNPSSSTTTIQLSSLDLSPVPPNPEYTVDSLYTKTQFLEPGNAPIDTVHFIPTHVGADTGIIPVYWIGESSNNYPIVYLIGTGVGPEVISNGYRFPNERVDSGSPPVTIWIANIGTDTTAIESVTILDSTELMDSDFQVMLDSLPSSGHNAPLRIGYEGGDSTFSFTVQFHPHSLGTDTLVIRILTVDGNSVFDTIMGTGVEPLVLLNTRTIDLGTIMVLPHGSADSTIDTSFVVSNVSGTYPAILDTLTHDIAGNFAVQLNQPTTSHEALAAGDSVKGTVTFTITAVGDFFDTIRIPNDTRYYLYHNSDSNYQPMIVLKAKVRIGSIGSFAVSFDTIRTCDSIRDTATISNPYPVEVSIDSIDFVSDTAGFSYKKDFGFPIYILPNGTFPIDLVYSFPIDSLNGSQALKIALFQTTLDSEPPVVDTITANVVRQQQVMTLAAHLPPVGSVGMSAADIAELRVPITLEGMRSGITELDSWTLSLQFSNDLFVPTGYDITNSLSVAGDASYSLTPYWDQSTRTYTIIATGTAASDPARIANDLLITILMQAYVTTDTAVTVTPTFTWVTRPCAYNLQSFTLSIPYADDCGDPTLRDVMEGETPSFILTGSWPNPATSLSEVSIGYYASEPSEVTATVFSAAAISLGQIVRAVGAGAGTFTLPEPLIPVSGPAFVRVEAVSSDGSNSVIQTCKIAVMK